MSEKTVILIADYVPLMNKGEEAIVRGIEQMFGGADRVEIGLLDNVPAAETQGNIHVFPAEWIFRVSHRHLSNRRRILGNAVVSAKLLCGIYGKLRRLVRGVRSRHAPLRAFFGKADGVVVGHDGVFCPESCGILRLAKRAGKAAGILGSGVNVQRRLHRFVKRLYPRAVRDGDFCFLRERRSYEYLARLGAPADRMELAPDPAFAMPPAPPEAVGALLESFDWYRAARAAGRPVVAVTVCERSIVFIGAFRSVADPGEKRKVHSEFIAGALDRLVAERGAVLAFLPHCIEEGEGDDLAVARRVIARMGDGRDSAHIIESDISPMLLKGVIRACDFLVAERTHSAIGSVGVATPFVMFTNTADTRTHDILGEMCDAEAQLIDMDAPDAAAAGAEVLAAFDRREAIRRHLSAKGGELQAHLADVAATVTRAIQHV